MKNLFYQLFRNSTLLYLAVIKNENITPKAVYESLEEIDVVLHKLLKSVHNYLE